MVGGSSIDTPDDAHDEAQDEAPGSTAGGAKASAKPGKKVRNTARETVPDADAAGEVAAEGGGGLRKKELIDRVVAATGARRRDAGPAVEATLAALGDALARGEALVLPPLGRMRVVKRKDSAKGGTTLTLKLSRGGAKGAAGEGGLAEPAESD